MTPGGAIPTRTGSTWSAQAWRHAHLQRPDVMASLCPTCQDPVLQGGHGRRRVFCSPSNRRKGVSLDMGLRDVRSQGMCHRRGAAGRLLGGRDPDP